MKAARSWDTVLYIGVISLAVLILYLPYAKGFQSCDDWEFIYKSHAGQSLRGFIGFFIPHDDYIFFRPLTQRIIPLINMMIFGLNPLGPRLVNYIVLIINSILVYLIFMRLSGYKLFGFTTAFLYSIHFAHSLCILLSHIQGLGETLFSLLSLYLYIQSRKKEDSRSIRLCSQISFVLALLSRESAIMVPIVIAAYELLFPPPNDSTSTLHRIMRNLGAYFVIAGVYLSWRFLFLGIPWPSEATSYRPIPSFGKILYNHSRYLYLALYNYRWPEMAILCSSMLWLVWLIFNRRSKIHTPLPRGLILRIMIFSLALYMITLSPVVALLFVFDHYQNTAIVGVVAVIALGLFSISLAVARRFLRYGTVTLCAVLALMFYLALSETRMESTRSRSYFGEVHSVYQAKYRGFLRELKSLHNDFPIDAYLVFVNFPGDMSGEDMHFAELIRVHYQDWGQRLNISFAASPSEVPSQVDPMKTYFFTYENGHVRRLPRRRVDIGVVGVGPV